MRKLISIMIVSMMLILMVIPANAASGDILKGSPVLDGTLDDIYTQSLKHDLDNFDFYAWGDYATSITGSTYFLWDSDFLYVCTVINDSTISSAGEDYIKAETNPWQNDAVESWYYDVGTHAEGEKFKIHNDAYGITMFGSDGTVTIDMDKAQYKTSIDGNKYTIELALPFGDLKDGREIGFALQVNDIANNDNSAGSASGTQVPGDNIFKLVGTEVTYPVVEEVIVEAPVEEAPAAVAEVTAPVSAAPAPQTSDYNYTVIAAIMLVMSAVAVVTLKKRTTK